MWPVSFAMLVVYRHGDRNQESTPTFDDPVQAQFVLSELYSRDNDSRLVPRVLSLTNMYIQTKVVSGTFNAPNPTLRNNDVDSACIFRFTT